MWQERLLFAAAITALVVRPAESDMNKHYLLTLFWAELVPWGDLESLPGIYFSIMQNGETLKRARFQVPAFTLFKTQPGG